MTILSKMKTLIEYAKFGMALCKYHNNELHKKTDTYEFIIPRSIQEFRAVAYIPWATYATSITGKPTVFGTNGALKNFGYLEYIELPKVTSILGTRSFSNPTLKICKLPALCKINVGYTWENSTALEYLELGKVTDFHTRSVQGCTALKEFYVKEGTTGSLFLHFCPNLTQECLHKIIENYADMTGLTAPTFHIGEENLAKIDEEHIAMLENKNIFYQ